MADRLLGQLAREADRQNAKGEEAAITELYWEGAAQISRSKIFLAAEITRLDS